MCSSDLVVLVVAILAMTSLIYLLPETSVSYVSNYSLKDKNNYTRVDQSAQAFKRFQDNYVLGDGYRTRKEILPHNLEMTVLAETGLLGAITFVWMLIAQAQIFAQARKLFAGDALRECVVVATIACSIAVLVQAQFDPYWRRGPLWIPWCGTGLILAMMYQEMQARRAARAIAAVEEDRIWWEQRAERVARRRAEMTAPDRDYSGSKPKSNGTSA